MAFPETDIPLAPPIAESFSAETRVRYHVLGMLCLLSFILYLDRICIGQAVGPIKKELGLSDTAMGFVLAAFTVAYGLFEVPTGHWGDRYGSRGVLTRIVLWWSAFTALTGAASGLMMLLVVRFLFGAGEAGALPNAARVVSRWFPAGALGPAQGIVVTSALVGGAVAPVVAQYLIQTLGWRWAFAALGFPGIAWAVVFYVWFRDDPAEHPGVNDQERQLIAAGRPATTTADQHPQVPWRRVLCSANIWLLGGVVTCGAATTYLIFSWYPTYLQEGRGVSPNYSAWLTSMVLAGGAVGSTTGGWLSDYLVRRTGNRRSTRRAIGTVSLGSAGLALLGSISCSEPWLAASCCTWACFAIHVQLAAWWGVVTEISGNHLGALFGLMNSLGIPGAVGSQLFLGRFVDWLKSLGRTGRAQWDPAFYIYAGVLMIGAVLWLKIDATKSAVEPGMQPHLRDDRARTES